ncbi:MAG: protease modulator HflC [Candidatus Brocadiales bacterium]|nr:protease modulator HflC [Candidatus Brocadiales bacterium]
MKKLITTLIIIVVLVIVLVILGPFYILNEGEQAVITRFGAIINTHTEAGLKIKVPFVDNVVKYPKKVLSWDGDSQRIPTKENQFIWVDTTARWKIIDPLKFYEAVNTIDQGYARLDDIVDSTVRTVIAENFLSEAIRNSNRINEMIITEQLQAENVEDSDQLKNLTQIKTQSEDISKGREKLSNEMFKLAAGITIEEYGIELLDILIRQIRYSDDLTESVYERMIKERNQIAEAYRSFGEGKKAEWLGKQENDKKTILSEAYATSEEIKGTADAEATKIYADSYSADPTFFEFWRTLDSYKKVIAPLDKILSTDMEYFDYLYTKEGAATE